MKHSILKTSSEFSASSKSSSVSDSSYSSKYLLMISSPSWNDHIMNMQQSTIPTAWLMLPSTIFREKISINKNWTTATVTLMIVIHFSRYSYTSQVAYSFDYLLLLSSSWVNSGISSNFTDSLIGSWSSPLMEIFFYD